MAAIENNTPPFRSSQDLSVEAVYHNKLSTVGSLSAGVAHDLNNLFTGMLSYTDILSAELQDQHLQHYVEKIENAIEHAIDLTVGVTTFLKDQDSQPTLIDPIKNIDHLTEIIGRCLGSNIELSVIVPKSSHPILMNPSRFGQILLNLVINARDAIEDFGTIIICAKYYPIKNPSHLIISVADSGKGIDSDVIESIFEPFFTTKGNNKGTGIGLSIVKNIVDEIQGEISVDSTPGQGTTFKVSLPLAKK